jgi:hypothetical protein
MKKLNVKCTAPKLCRKLERTRDVCMLNGAMCGPFVDTFAQLLPLYDCSFNQITDKDKVLVPAIWKCENLQSSVTNNALSQVKTVEAAKLYATQLFRDSLNGPAAMSHYTPSLEREKKLRELGIIH